MARRRVLVIDDSVVSRRFVADVLTAEQGFEVFVAPNGRLGLDKLGHELADLVILDVEMPELDGIETLRRIRQRYPTMPVIMFSALTERAGALTLEALAHGASDYITKPSSVSSPYGRPRDAREIGAELLAKVSALLEVPRVHPTTVRRATPRAITRPPVEVLAIGASTGGPMAVTQILAELPAGFAVPIVVVQHMPAMFTALFAQRLAEQTALVCREAVAGAVLAPGEVWVAAGGSHLVVVRDRSHVRLVIDDGPPENSCKPAVDVLFRSVAATFGAATLGVVLTGMGFDGLRGAEAITGAGGEVLVQDQASSVVGSMPGAIADAGLASAVVPLSQLAGELVRRVQRRPR